MRRGRSYSREMTGQSLVADALVVVLCVRTLILPKKQKRLSARWVGGLGEGAKGQRGRWRSPSVCKMMPLHSDSAWYCTDGCVGSSGDFSASIRFPWFSLQRVRSHGWHWVSAQGSCCQAGECISSINRTWSRNDTAGLATMDCFNTRGGAARGYTLVTAGERRRLGRAAGSLNDEAAWPWEGREMAWNWWRKRGKHPSHTPWNPTVSSFIKLNGVAMLFQHLNCGRFRLCSPVVCWNTTKQPESPFFFSLSLGRRRITVFPMDKKELIC